jgi:hypothetical protein
VAQIGEATMKEKFASLMADQNIGTIRRGVKPFYFKDLGNIKEKKFKSVMVVTDLTFVMELLFFTKGENPLDVDFEKSWN